MEPAAIFQQDQDGLSWVEVLLEFLVACQLVKRKVIVMLLTSYISSTTVNEVSARLDPTILRRHTQIVKPRDGGKLYPAQDWLLQRLGKTVVDLTRFFHLPQAQYPVRLRSAPCPSPHTSLRSASKKVIPE